MAGGAAAFAGDHDDGLSLAFFEEAGVGVHQGVVIDVCDFAFAGCFGLGEFVLALGGAGFELGDFFVDEALGFGEGGFGIGQILAELVSDFHELEFAGFECVDLFFVADDLGAELGVFFVLFGLELLVFETLDGVLTSADVEFDVFDLDFVGLEVGLGGGDGGGVVGEAFLGSFLKLGDFDEFCFEVLDRLISFLEAEELLHIFAHAKELAAGAGGGKGKRRRLSPFLLLATGTLACGFFCGLFGLLFGGLFGCFLCCFFGGWWGGFWLLCFCFLRLRGEWFFRGGFWEEGEA